MCLEIILFATRPGDPKQSVLIRIALPAPLRRSMSDMLWAAQSRGMEKTNWVQLISASISKRIHQSQGVVVIRTMRWKWLRSAEMSFGRTPTIRTRCSICPTRQTIAIEAALSPPSATRSATQTVTNGSSSSTRVRHQSPK